MADVKDIKISPLMDEISELRKRVFALQLLDQVDIMSLDADDHNSWVGLLHDSVDLLDQCAIDIRILSASLEKSINEVRSGTSAKL